MENPESGSKQAKPARQRLRLPFEKRPSDIGLWSYRHRRGIYVTVIAYLIFAIAFVSAKIYTPVSRAYEGILIEFPEDMPTVEEMERIRDILEQMDDWRNVANLASNENAELNADLRDDRGTPASEIYNDAASLDDKMRANREAYEEGLRNNQQLIEQARQGSTDPTAAERSDMRQQGNVTVSFSFTAPVRTSRKLVVPAYMCEGGGQVVVNATLNINGEVVAATVDKSRSTSDQCMQTTAVNAARSSLFNLDTSAPDRHRGTITYLFVPQ